jgi:hypothetical protein
MTGSRFVVSLFLLAFTLLFSAPGFAQDRAQMLQEIEDLKKQLKAKEKEFLEPAAQDKTAHAAFLSQADTGVIRLLPREAYQNKLLINGGGAYYSFPRLTHEYGHGSDISLEQGYLSVGFAGYDFGFLLNLGNVPIEAVNLEYKGVEFLANYTPPSIEPEIREQQRASSRGVQANGFAYQNRIVARKGNTYILRSINYRDSDVLVALRITRQDTDGSLILLWKILKEFPVPQAARS